MTEQYQCQSYSDDDRNVQDCTCGKCGNTQHWNTPDTEVEEIITFIEVDGVGIVVKKAGGKLFLCVSGSKEYITDLTDITSRDTYWKERVGDVKFDIEALRGSPRDTDIEYARAITDVHKILDTLLDNLK